MYLHKAFLHILPVICTLAQVDRSDGLIDVRLNDGPSQYVGTVEYSKDGGMTWNTTCGNHLFLNEVRVICRQLGFQGANAVIRNSPFKSGQAASYFSCEKGTQASLDECTIKSPCLPDVQPLGGAACYDDRYLGCFRDNRNGERVLPDNQFVSDMTIEKCIQYCRNNTEYVYAGVEDGDKCYCGDASANYSRFGRLGDDGCQFSCAGYRYSSCGGHDGIAVFNLSMGSVTLPSGTTESISAPSSDTSSLMTTDHRFSLTSNEAQSQGNASKIGLYAGAGGGGGAFLVIIIVMIIVLVTCRRRQAMNSTGENDMAQVKPSPLNPAALYAMPDLSAKSSKAKHVTRDPLEQLDDPSTMYTMPDKQAKNAHHPNGSENENDFGAMYATSTKARPETIGMEAPSDARELYALPDKKHSSTVVILSKAGNTTPQPKPSVDDVGLLYARPDKNRGEGKCDDETAMVENELYSFA